MKRTLTDNGYILAESGKYEHREVWEQHKGKIPKGYEIHHINHNRQDNRIENLALLPAKVHHRIHAGCIVIDGKWWKRCVRCKKRKPMKENFYVRKGHINSWCKTCVKEVVKLSRLKKSRSKSAKTMRH